MFETVYKLIIPELSALGHPFSRLYVQIKRMHSKVPLDPIFLWRLWLCKAAASRPTVDAPTQEYYSIRPIN